MDADTVQDWILAGNSAAMDWYALAHHEPLPSQSALERTFGIDFGSVSPEVGLAARGVTGAQIVLALAAVGALIWIFRK